MTQPMEKKVRIAAGQGFYGDSPMSAIRTAMAGATDYFVHDALAELTLSILQKDRMRDPQAGYARDIDILAKTLYPMALAKGMRIVTNSGGLNPHSAAQRVVAALAKQGLKGKKVAVITGDDVLPRLAELQEGGETLAHLDTGVPFAQNTYEVTHANVYVGAQAVADALAAGADIILAGRVADPCLTLGILMHEFGWQAHQYDLLAAGITIGHLLECGGQASGGNSYAEWPMDYGISNLGYPIAEVSADGTAVFSILDGDGGRMSRDTLREQLVYEIHDPANYMTPDVTVDLTQVQLHETSPGHVRLSGVRGRPRPERLKLTIGLNEGYTSEQFFFFSRPFAYEKAQKFIAAAHEIWDSLPVMLERREVNLIGINGIHGEAAPAPSQEWIDQMNEIGVRVCVKHSDERAGKIAMQGIVCLGLNGPPGAVGIPGWGKVNRAMLSLWPTLIDRRWITEQVTVTEV
jgi:hypothetical protein